MAFLSNAGLERLWAKITDKLSIKVDKVDGKGLSTNDYTTAEKNKLSGIDTGANKTTVDSVLSTTSTNPVQNKVVNTAISNLNTLVGDKSVSSQISSAIASKADTGHTHTKSEVGLGNVDNTADADKSVKYATSAGSAASVTGTVDFAHGGTGRTNRDSAYSALMSGGTYAGDLNDCLNCGHYLISTSNTNHPLQDDTYGWMHVYTKERDSSNVLQEVTALHNLTKYVRTYNASVWTAWKEIRTTDDLWKQEFKYIPSGANLNDYVRNGIYISSSFSNTITNLPQDGWSTTGAFTLIVTGISQSTYTTQILFSISNPAAIWIRNQTNWQSPQVWTNWFRLVTEQVYTDAAYIELNPNIRDVETQIRFNRANSNRAKYTRLYEANTSNGELAIAQQIAGGSTEAITRLNWNGDHVTLRQDSSKLWLGDSTAPTARFYTADYGTSLPTTHSKGRVFFLKA